MNVHRPATLLIVFLIFGLTVAAQVDDGLEADAKALEGQLIAPCCWRQPVSVHDSPASEQVKSQIRLLLGQGLGKEEVREAFVSQYGERILAAPRPRGFNLLSYLLPLLGLLLGAGLVWEFLIRHRMAEASASGAAPKSSIHPRYSRILEEELKQ